MKIYKFVGYVFLLAIGLSATISCSSCQSQKSTVQKNESTLYKQISPDFNKDSAYTYIQKQVDFGPRIPNTPEHTACGNYLVEKLTSFGAKVTEQKVDITHYNGQNIHLRNIIGSYSPEKEKRVLLAAHWDSRPFADQEKDADKQKQHLLGADDGASGVGVLLEIARQLQQKKPDIGVDIILFDFEDWGQAQFDENIIPGNWWCMGSQYWAKNPHVKSYKAYYGILLDMVGANNATFMKEGYSVQYASNVVEKIWRTAVNLGYEQFFINRQGGYITDDHVAINELHRAPCVDIINTKDSKTGFVSHWHTLNDNMNNINKETLKAVGQTVMEVVFKITN